MLGKLRIFILLFVGGFIPTLLSAQTKTERDSIYVSAHEFVLSHQQQDSTSAIDSTLIQTIEHLNWYTRNDTLIHQFRTLRNIINQNRAHYMLLDLEKQYDTLLTEKKLYDSLRRNYITFETLIEEMDSTEISTSDSNFVDLLDEFVNETFDRDSAAQKDSNAVQPFEQYYHNDTLISSVKKLLDYYKQSEFLQWIKTVRRDTFDFYVVNIEGDSLLVQLYDANPNIVRFELTDYWGSTINAMVRNISSNSFKILIDDAPSIKYETSEKAITALEGMKKKAKGPTLTVKKRKIVNNIKPWLIYGNGNLDLSQIGMYQWAQGGEATLSFVGGTELNAKYKKQKQNWDTYVRLGFGVLRQGRYADTSENFRPYEDRIEVNSKYGIKLLPEYNITIEGDFKSQFGPQHEWDGNTKQEMISRFMSPGYATFSLGLDYLKHENFTMFISPASSRTTFVLDTAVSIKERYNVDSNMNYRSEFGFRIRATHKMNIWGDITLNNKVELYSNYLYKPKNVDINWEMGIEFPVNDYIRATFSTHLIYDDDQMVPKYRWNEIMDENGNGTGNFQWEKHESPGLQFKEAIKLGIYVRF